MPPGKAALLFYSAVKYSLYFLSYSILPSWSSDLTNATLTGIICAMRSIKIPPLWCYLMEKS